MQIFPPTVQGRNGGRTHMCMCHVDVAEYNFITIFKAEKMQWIQKRLKGIFSVIARSCSIFYY